MKGSEGKGYTNNGRPFPPLSLAPSLFALRSLACPGRRPLKWEREKRPPRREEERGRGRGKGGGRDKEGNGMDGVCVCRPKVAERE